MKANRPRTSGRTAAMVMWGSQPSNSSGCHLVVRGQNCEADVCGVVDGSEEDGQRKVDPFVDNDAWAAKPDALKLASHGDGYR